MSLLHKDRIMESVEFTCFKWEFVKKDWKTMDVTILIAPNTSSWNKILQSHTINVA